MVTFSGTNRLLVYLQQEGEVDIDKKRWESLAIMKAHFLGTVEGTPLGSLVFWEFRTFTASIANPRYSWQLGGGVIWYIQQFVIYKQSLHES